MFYLENECVYISSDMIVHRVNRHVGAVGARWYGVVNRTSGSIGSGEHVVLNRHVWWSVQRRLVYTINPVCGVVAACSSTTVCSATGFFCSSMVS